MSPAEHRETLTVGAGVPPVLPVEEREHIKLRLRSDLLEVVEKLMLSRLVGLVPERTAEIFNMLDVLREDLSRDPILRVQVLGDHGVSVSNSTHGFEF